MRPSSQPPGGVDCGDAAGEIAIAGALEPGGFDAVDQLGLCGEAADAFDEILVSVAIADDECADARQDLEGVEVVEPGENRQDDVTEFQAEEASARLEDAARLGEGGIDMGDVAQAEGDGIGVDAGIGDRQPLGVAAQPVDAVQYAAIDGAVAADVQHGLGDVADDDPARTAAALDDAEGDVAGAAGDVEDGLAGARVEAIDEIALPQPVDA